MYRCAKCYAEFPEEEMVELLGPSIADDIRICPRCGHDLEDAEEGSECRICGGFVGKKSSVDVCDACFLKTLSPARVRQFHEDGQAVTQMWINPLLATIYDEMDIETILWGRLMEDLKTNESMRGQISNLMCESLDGNESAYMEWLKRRRVVLQINWEAGK